MDESQVLCVGLDWEVDGIDPACSFGGWNTGRVVQQTHESLMEDGFETPPDWPGQPTRIIPRLAESCSVSDDARHFTFRLRDGIRFHDNAPLDAEAVALNYSRFCDPQSWAFSSEAADLNSAAADMIAKVEAIDGLTFKITLKRPTPDFLRYMTQEDAPGAQSMISPAAMKKYGSDGCIDRAPGTGAFSFHRRFDTPNGSGVELKRNDRYWGIVPKLSGIRFVPYPTLDERVRALVEGEVDVAYSLEGADLAELQQRGFTVPEYSAPYIWYLVFNLRDPKIGDLRVRRALAHAINREALSNELFPGATVPACSTLPPGSPSHDPNSEDRYPYNPEIARKLLADAGCGDGLTLHVVGAQAGSAQLNPSEIYDRIETDLAAVGVKLRVKLHPDWVDYCNEWKLGVMPGVAFSEMSWAMSSDLWLSQVLHSKNVSPGGFNAGYLADTKLDELFDRAATTLNDADRIQLYREADRHIMDQLPILPLLNSKQGMVGYSSRVKGLVSVSQCWHDFRNVYLD